MATRKKTTAQPERKARSYKIINNKRPLSVVIQNRDKASRRLQEADTLRSLRYARNYPTPYVDEQDEDRVIIEPIVFIDGMLHVPAENVALQHFLHIHPDNGKKFIEIDPERDAMVLVEQISLRTKAVNTAQAMDMAQLEEVASVLIKGNVKGMKAGEIKRDVFLYAETHPKAFLNILDDPHLKLRATVTRLFDSRILTKENKNREVWVEMADDKKKLLNIPFAMDAKEVVTDYFLTDEGVTLLKKLEKSVGIK